MHESHHPNINTHRLYLHCFMGGRDITGLEDTHNNKCSVLTKYVVKSNDPLTQVVRETTLPTQKFLLKSVSAPMYIIPDLMGENMCSNFEPSYFM
eukprot:7061786-Ditylum_brightwellii.AAC.1